jgi:hypothetical protein
MKSGLMERFHALPMSRWAVLTREDARRPIAQCVRGSFDDGNGLRSWLAHPHNVLALVAAGLLVLLFGYAMPWLFAIVGLCGRGIPSRAGGCFPVLAPLVFCVHRIRASGVDPRVAPGVRSAPTRFGDRFRGVRALTIGGPTTAEVWQAIAWCAGFWWCSRR